MDWVKFDEQMPEEEETFMAKYYGTDKWKPAMFKTAKYSLLFTIESEGHRLVVDGKMIDGEPKCDYARLHPGVKYIAWMPYPDPFKN